MRFFAVIYYSTLAKYIGARHEIVEFVLHCKGEIKWNLKLVIV